MLIRHNVTHISHGDLIDVIGVREELDQLCIVDLPIVVGVEEVGQILVLFLREPALLAHDVLELDRRDLPRPVLVVVLELLLQVEVVPLAPAGAFFRDQFAETCDVDLCEVRGGEGGYQ